MIPSIKKQVRPKGFTLVEVLVVIVIIGILSSMGMVSFRQSIANSRVRDSAINVAAFLERVSMTARETNDAYCVTTFKNSIKIYAYKGTTCSGDAVDSLVLEGGVFFRKPDGMSSPSSDAVTNLVDTNAYFVPRVGLSPFRGSDLSNQTNEGFYLLQYSTSDTWGGVTKNSTKNNFRSHSYNGAWRNL